MVELSAGTAPRELEPGMMVGEYRIEGTLGTGGMGTVYAAVHPIIGKRAAIKVISYEMLGNPDAVERFLFEARSVNAIGDPNIVDIFGVGVLPDGRVYLVMERLVGETLATRCEYELLSVTEVVHIIGTVARTLDTVHQRGFVHRDLKPDNVFLARRGATGWPYDVVLLDFGIAKLVGDDGGSQLTRTGTVIGTPSYVSPEQARGAPVDARADVYSLGILAYELLAGNPPFVAGSAVEVMAMHIHARPVPPRLLRTGVPIILDDLVLAMLAKRPADRPSLAECRRRLAASIDPGRPARPGTLPVPPVARPQPTPPATVLTPEPGRFPAPKGSARVWLVAALGAAVVLAAVLGGAAMLARARAPRDDLAAAPSAPAEVPSRPRPASAATAAVPPPPESAAPAVKAKKPERTRKRRPRRRAERWTPAALGDPPSPKGPGEQAADALGDLSR